MKTLLLLFVFISSLPVSAQVNSDSVDIRFNENVKEFRSLGIVNTDIENTISCVNDFKKEYSQLLQLEDLSNVAVQKAILKDYVDKCAYYINDEESGGIKVGFKSIDVFTKYMNLRDIVMKSNASIKVLDFLIADNTKKSAALNSYIQKNLTRLKISFTDWDKMSDNDRRLLAKSFQ